MITMIMKLAPALACLGLFAIPAAAQDNGEAAPNTRQDLFSLPPGCTAYMTMQSQDCNVEHNFLCEGDPEGHKRRASLDEQGLTYLGTTDYEAQWINSFHPLVPNTEELLPDPVDPANFSELLATGEDTFDFQTASPTYGITRYVGRDLLTGSEQVIDGVTLMQTDYDVTAYTPDGTFIYRTRGNEWLHPEWRMFLSGEGIVTTADGDRPKSDNPVEFLFPGDDGFLSANPKYGCGVMVSSLEGRP